MMKAKSPVNLSVRGEAAIGDHLSQMFDIISNLWHPTEKPDGWLSLGVAENDTMHSKMTAYIEKTFTVPSKLLTYNDGGAGSRRLTTAIAKFLNRRLKPFVPLQKDHIVVTNGSSSALDALSYCLADRGDGFLLGRPFYRAFIPDFETRPGSKIVQVSFETLDPMGLDAVKCYEETIKQCQATNQPIKGLILCHPHNPLGRCYPVEVVTEYMKLCQKYQIHLISDEIYALSIWDNTVDTDPPPTPFVSASTIDTTNLIDPHLVHLVWGMSKDFGANGLRIGCIITQSNRDLVSAVQSLSLYTYPSNIADNITATILEDDAFTDTYLAENSARMSQRYTLATNFFRDHDIPYVPGANAAFFIVADLGAAYRNRHPDFGPDQNLTAVLMKNLLAKKVFLVDSDAIGSETPGLFRVVFTQYEEYLLEGLKRIVAAVEHVDEPADGEVVSNGIPLRSKPGDAKENPEEALLS